VSERDRDRDRPKKSWREIDSQRDRSGGPRPEGGHKPSAHQSEAASKQYRAQLDALFAKGEVGKFAEKLTGGPPSLRASQGEPKPAEPAPQAAPSSAPPPPPKEDPRAVLRKKLLEAIGRDDISRAFDRYVKAHGMPGDFELLEQGLEHNKADKQAEVLAALEQLLARDKPKRSRTLSGKLRFIEETSSDEDLRVAAARIRARIG
jgi:hypothetical protein